MTAVFLAVLALSLGTRTWLSCRQERFVLAHRGAVPEDFAGTIPLAAHQKAADYTVAKLRLGRLEAPARAAVLLGWTLGGGLDLLDRHAGGVAFLMTAFLLTEAVLFPFDVYRVFRLEERFGFNRTTPRLFAVDLLKQGALALVLGIPVCLLALWLMESGGSLWWVRVWAGWLALSLLLTWAYPALIAPLFHKFTPLEDAELDARIRELVRRTGFKQGGVYLVDGSRRSAHANAYFAGLGPRKRVVLFDTLRDILAPEEVVAVLAHEFGHFKRNHVWSRLLFGSLLGLGGLALLGILMERPGFFVGLGIDRPSSHAGLLLFLWIGPLFAFPLRPLFRAWSRKHEYEADAFAAAHADAGALVRALVKLYDTNAATLTPDPLHSAFHDTHPPAALRIARLRQLG